MTRYYIKSGDSYWKHGGWTNQKDRAKLYKLGDLKLALNYHGSLEGQFFRGVYFKNIEIITVQVEETAVKNLHDVWTEDGIEP